LFRTIFGLIFRLFRIIFGAKIHVQGTKPLVGRSVEETGLAPPAMRVLMGELAEDHQAVAEGGEDQGLGFSNFNPAEGGQGDALGGH
jgi:hypothetical protein